MAEGIRAAVRAVQNLSDLLEDTSQPVTGADRLVRQLSEDLQEMSRLPKPQRPPVTLTGLDYLVAVESVLAEPSERLLHDLHRIRQLFDEELAPAITALKTPPRVYVFGVDGIAQDLSPPSSRVSTRTARAGLRRQSWTW
ncbi:hypothetical protein ACIBMX_48660 [Streptomyces phaeochromogenes]|uniref:hypothetical protein n=1 Tax=Streptomyces phaeochromogenes TaxID=1923 RepID=UPI0033E99069